MNISSHFSALTSRVPLTPVGGAAPMNKESSAAPPLPNVRLTKEPMASALDKGAALWVRAPARSQAVDTLAQSTTMERLPLSAPRPLLAGRASKMGRSPAAMPSGRIIKSSQISFSVGSTCMHAHIRAEVGGGRHSAGHWLRSGRGG